MHKLKKQKLSSVSNPYYLTDRLTAHCRGTTEKMSKTWTSPVYAFFKPIPIIEYVNGCHCHTFKCTASGCNFSAHHYLDTGDKLLMGNMIRHVCNKCWGQDAWKAANACRNADDALKLVVAPLKLNGSITAVFQRTGKGKVTYLHVQHTREQTNAWPFKIVSDCGFLSLMKTGRPGYYILSPSQVSRDVKLVFAQTHERIAKILQEYDGCISFGTNAWTSPNHYAYIAITAHLELDGSPIAMVLDLVELPKLHSGLNLAIAFQNILQDFGIENKVSKVKFPIKRTIKAYHVSDSEYYVR
ncbi:hypothetical protein BDN70DRAFT_819880 [Pholiota conissans]|uniref:Uncharacterized protein n=1 Tax=Pholiota conissans TaxID=109636 RepID=A0A9P6CMA4_9AGAR|nr:hypothetical protein BDN70DRAFT_819880 [Pholiota conissans]